jgi:aspartate/methionine/tyrosine aminotransferase
LDEENGWALAIDELERSFAEAKSNFDLKALVVINPGNPTGQVLTKQNIEEIIKFAHKHHLFLFADEVSHFLGRSTFIDLNLIGLPRECLCQGCAIP